MDRIKNLNQKPVKKNKFVVYWMQQSQRVEYNHALEHAVTLANELNLSVIVLFILTPSFPDANLRHYSFMLQGLREVFTSLQHRGIKMVVRLGDPVEEVAGFSKSAAVVITDMGYLRIQRAWRKRIAEQVPCQMIQLESDVVVPLESVSNKEEYSAATLRRKITPLIPQFLVPVKQVKIKNSSLKKRIKTIDITKSEKVLKLLKIDFSVGAVQEFSGGTVEARRLLKTFIRNKLKHFNNKRNHPELDYTSNLSPYLHFGQISPVYIAEQIKKQGDSESVKSFLEELIVRRELAMNFVYYNNEYDNFKCLHAWARTTLRDHANDNREYLYSINQFENAETHDPYWNAAQMQMVQTGKMHGYMRMYWGKKILEWSSSPEQAFDTALYLNNKYELDGRDPNGFTGVAWCFGKHDRAWKERPVFGKVRYMNANGLKRKFKIDQFVKDIEDLYPGAGAR